MEFNPLGQQKDTPASEASEATSYFPWCRFALPFSERRILLILGDMLLLVLSVFLTIFLRYSLQKGFVAPAELVGTQRLWLFFVACIWMLIAVVNEGYSPRTAAQPRRVLRALLITTIEAGLLYVLLFFIFSRPAMIARSTSTLQALFLSKEYPLPRMLPAGFLAIACTTVSLWRLAYIRLFSSAALRRRTLIVGAGWSGRTIARAIHETVTDYEILGYIDDDPAKLGTRVGALPVLGSREDLVQLTRSLGVNEIVLAITHTIHGGLFAALMQCFEQGIAIKPMPIVSEEVLRRVPVEHLGQRWFVTSCLNSVQMPTFYQAFKRVIDIVISLVGLGIFAFVLPFIALAIRLDSPGSIFYTQERLGRGGRVFRVIKFRSMIANAEAAQQAVWATRGDARITRVGNVLRRLRLDEIPQFWNVFRGEMSIVGPRPERPEFVAQLQQEIPFYRARLSVKPGLTGWAQVKYRYGSSVKDALVKLQYDLYYIKHQSFLLDLLIISRTLKVMLTCKGL